MFEIVVKDFETELGLFRELTDERKILRMVNRDIAPPVERRLDAVLRTPAPPRTNQKFVWSFNREANTRARRWWFRQIKLGNIPTDGEHYIRSNTIINAWISEIRIDGDAILFTLSNPAPGASHVYGSPEQTQVPGHASTGWQHYTVFVSFFDQIIPDIIEAWDKLVRTSTKRRR
jgi:hypothetical protein